MPYRVDIKDAEKMFPDYTFVGSLTPSEQKAAFHVKDKAGTDLCLKLIAPNYERDRLDREIQALQNINHPNVVKLIEYTFSSKPGQWRHYIVEEFIEGQDLQAILVPGKPWYEDDPMPTTWQPGCRVLQPRPKRNATQPRKSFQEYMKSIRLTNRSYHFAAEFAEVGG